MLVRVRQQRQVTRALDLLTEQALMLGARPGDTAGHDLAGFGDVLSEQFQIFVVYLLFTQTAEFLAGKTSSHDVTSSDFESSTADSVAAEVSAVSVSAS